METLRFALEIEDDWPPVGTENVWCERVGSCFRLRNIPFFISGLAVDDLFTAEPDPVNDHIFEFQVVESSGRSVVWVLGTGDVDLSGFKERLKALGCRYEGFQQFSLTAIDVPPDADALALDELFEEYEEKGAAFAFPVWRLAQ